MPFSYEDKYHVIVREIRKRRSKWQLDILRFMDFEDVEQILKLHIWKKWHLWDQTRKLENWISRVCSNQIKNLMRNHYTNYARPCVQCKHSLGEEGCASTPSGEQCSECPLYAKWLKNKVNGYNIKMPLELENHTREVNEKTDDGINYQETFRRLHEEMEKVLSPKEFLAFNLFFVDAKTDDEVADLLRIKEDPKAKNSRKKQIAELKAKLFEITQKVLKESDVGEFWP